ncbi:MULTISPECIES: helix-turn-helix domain-containing protein [unclassified Streptomyces]|uniref:helix-turn-helix domain-containing protein n=1 Tax=unclassified Streptomyces TaxID=2593676 RepID=UPI0038164CF7
MPVSVNTNAIFAMRKVGGELARLREQARLRQDDIATLLGCSRHMVSKIERGKVFPNSNQLAKMLTAYSASIEERATIVAAIDQGKSFGRAWYEQPEIQAAFTGDSYRYFYLEDAAEKISTHTGTYVPGLLQTRGYVTALVEFAQQHEGVERRETFIEARLRRQQVLTRDHPATLDALCLESALRAAVGGPEVMREQLAYLLQCVKQHNITLRIIPFEAGAASVASTPFTVLDFPSTEHRSVAFNELIRGDMITDDTTQVRRSRRKFSDLARHALSSADSIRRIEEIEKELS